MNRAGCQICGIVPRQFEMFGSTRYWFYSFGDRLCLSCFHWSFLLLGKVVIPTHE